MTAHAQTRNLRIASYNIRKCVGLDWVRDPARIVAVFDELDADVIAVQELDRRMGARISSIPRAMLEAIGFDVVNFARRPGSLGWHGNGILIRHGLEISRAARIALPRLEPRGAVMVELALGLRVVCVHLGLIATSRRRQMGRIVSKLARLPDMPTVILGDFNEWAHHNPNLAVSEGFAVHVPGPSFHAARPTAALDLIIARDVAVMQTAVHSSILAKRASDHLPVWADIAL